MSSLRARNCHWGIPRRSMSSDLTAVVPHLAREGKNLFDLVISKLGISRICSCELGILGISNASFPIELRTATIFGRRSPLWRHGEHIDDSRHEGDAGQGEEEEAARIQGGSAMHSPQSSPQPFDSDETLFRRGMHLPRPNVVAQSGAGPYACGCFFFLREHPHAYVKIARHAYRSLNDKSFGILTPFHKTTYIDLCI